MSELIIDVLRFSSDDESTNSLIFINGKFQSFCLEDAYHETKIKGKTRIPAGRRKLGIRTAGRLHDIYAKKFPDMHKGMIWILDIPNFEYVYFHIGNKSQDTEGCPLVGNIQSNNQGGAPGSIMNSTDAYVAFYKRIIDDVIAGNAYANFHDVDLAFRNYVPNI